MLRTIFLDAKAPHLSSAIPPVLPWKVNEPVQPSEGLTRQGSGINGTFGQAEELRCVIAIIRQYVSFPILLDYLSAIYCISVDPSVLTVVTELLNRR